MTSISLEGALGLAWLAGLSIPVGAGLASHVVLRRACHRIQLDSSVSYFGGGALLAAIALVLIPRGIEHGSILFVAVAFAVGGLVFWQFSAWAKRAQSTAGLFTGMLLDFFPEALLLGAIATSSSSATYLLAGLIALQNLPEGFAAYDEMRETASPGSHLLRIFLAASLVGPLAAWLGYAWLSASESTLAVILLFCSGGILYLIFEDIAPAARSQHESFPALGAVGGFLLGLLGTMMVH